MTTKSTHLSRTILLFGLPLVIGAIGFFAYLASRSVTTELKRAASERLRNVGGNVAGVVTQYLSERLSDVQFLASTPIVVQTARGAGLDARARGWPIVTTEEMERRFGGRTTNRGSETLLQFLGDFRDRSDFTELLLTDPYGFTVTSTDQTSNFVQSARVWWRRAMEDGDHIGDPEFSETNVTLDIAVRITDPLTGDGLGVLRAVFPLGALTGIRTGADTRRGTTVEVVDVNGLIIVSRDSSRVQTTIDEWSSLSTRTEAITTPITAADISADLISATPAYGGRWWVIAREPKLAAYAEAATIRQSILIVSGVLLVITLLLITGLAAWLNQRVTRPVKAAGDVASRVTAGDLSVNVAVPRARTGEVGQLVTSVHKMVGALRSLVGAIRSSSDESGAMAQQISASTEEMSASAQQMASTCQDLSNQANQQAELVQQAVGDASRILDISTQLAEGARLASERNAALKAIADDHRARLLEGTEQLEHLASDIGQGAADAQALANLSGEIQKFVAQAQGIAAQTKTLALNAAIEASRAEGTGGGTRGFAVVADEVRKLAGQAGNAASNTSETVRSVLNTVQVTRERLTRLAEGSASVREIAESAASGLQEVADGAAETSAWTDEISGASADVRRYVEEVTERLKTIEEGTRSFVAAVEEIAASAEQQSASTEEIASSAAQLAEAAERLQGAVSTFRLGDQAATIRAAADGPDSAADLVD